MPSEIEFFEDAHPPKGPLGFAAAAAAADVRGKGDGRLDTGLICSARPCAAAGVFTRNAIAAAPVQECRRRLAAGRSLRGAVVNSGNANACTGARGLADAQAMAAAAERACGAPGGSFLVCSTGRIGEALPMEALERAIAAAGARAAQGAVDSEDFAKCILTSDTKTKRCAARFTAGGPLATLAGWAKGAGMVQPGMATMLAFLATDVEAPADVLQEALARAVRPTFNALTIDGDMSTNDTVLLFANGASGAGLGDAASRAVFEEALGRVCESLAEKIVGDGERTTKIVEIRVQGAASDGDAEKAARAVGNSLLVKTSWYGDDPNWGRLMDAIGYSGAQIDPGSIDIAYDDAPAVRAGEPLPQNKPAWKAVVSRPRFSIRIALGQGEGRFRLRATDLTEGYVNFNKSE